MYYMYEQSHKSLPPLRKYKNSTISLLERKRYTSFLIVAKNSKLAKSEGHI